MGHSTRRLMMGAAGAGGDSTYVDDVFSTYLWRGDGLVGRAIGNGIKLSNNNAGNSVHFDGNGDNLLAASSSEFTMTGDFTMECWFNPTSVSGVNVILNGRGNAGSGGPVIYINGTTLVFDNGTGTVCSQSSAVAIDTWYHVAGTRSGNTWTLYKNGSSVATGSDSTSYSSSVGFYIGQSHHGNEDYNGHISNVRITKGQVIYSGNFTPSTEALTTTSQGATASNVKLLCCQSSTSATAATKSPTTITANGNVQAQAFGPFTATDGEGGLVWMKSRTTGNVNVLFDTERGANQRLRSDSDFAQTNADLLQPSFTNSGFTVGSGNEVNGSGNEYTSWTFRKAKGFFDVVTWSGGGETYKNISHNLGSVPGCIIVKKYAGGSGDWFVYHRELNNGTNSWQYRVSLSNTWSEASAGQSFLYSAPTATQFQIGDWFTSSGNDYIAYVFAGGASDETGSARSVDFDASQEDALTTDHSSDFDFGSGDFTVECWIKPTNASQVDPTAVSVWNFPDGRRSWAIFGNTGGNAVNFDGSIRAAVSPDGQFATRTEITGKANLHQWNHVAFTRSGNTLDLFINGVSQGAKSFTGSVYSNTSDGIMIGGMGDPLDIRNEWDGGICNVRVVKGTAVYTSSFKPPTTGLTDITNTKLLCCNKNTVTGSTVTPGTITAHNSPTVRTDTPFDDPAGFKFGKGGDQNIIKCGSYVGNGSSNGPEINLGFEPQLILMKNAEKSENWLMWDSMRGIVTEGNDARLFPNLVNAESSPGNFINLTPTGFQINDNGGDLNENGDNIVYLAIRRPDPLVAKPVEVGSDVYALERGNSSSIEAYTSGFPVDFSLVREIGNASDWHQNSRLTQTYYLSTNTNGAQNGPYSAYSFDSNTGWLHGASAYNASWLSWMWKRGAGFDVVTDKGNGQTTKTIAHGLGVVPEMIWRKNRDNGSDNWQVYHIGLNGGTNPQLYRLYLNTTSAEMSDQWTWTNAPTDTHFTVGANGAVNRNNDDFITMLFASVEGVSKVGYYDGTGSAGNAQNIGFQPRFIMIKRANAVENWPTFNTILGLGAGNDPWLNIDDDASQFTGQDLLSVSSTGFTLNDGQAMMNASGGKYIYYAHA